MKNLKFTIKPSEKRKPFLVTVTNLIMLEEDILVFYNYPHRKTGNLIERFCTKTEFLKFIEAGIQSKQLNVFKY